MAMDVWYASDFDPLVDQLVDNVDERRRAGGTGVVQQLGGVAQVLVPSNDLGDYLELAVARRSPGGVATNYAFDRLQGFLSGKIEQAAGGVPNDGRAGDGLTVLDREVLRTLLVGQLADTQGLTGELEPVRGYIEAGRAPRTDGSDGGDGCATKLTRAVQTRRYQLAARMAVHFQEYSYSRPELLAGWEGEEPEYRFDADTAAGRTERWQAALWRRLCEHTDLGDDLLPIPRAFDAARGEVVESLAADLGDGALHVFGFAGVGAEFLRMLEDLSAEVDVQVYINGPAGEAFVRGAGDLDEPWEECGKQQTEQAAWHPALRNWGGLGAESLAQFADGADELRILEGKQQAGGLLGTLQAAIREPEAVERTAPDASLQLLECPGLRREAEVVANEIWKKLADDDSLQFSDVAVAVPQGKAETYLAHIESVFNAHRALPYTVNSMSLEGRSPVLDAAELLFQLPFGEFTRGELLSLLVHPNVRGRFRDVDEETWVEWTEDLNILYGADRDDQKREGRHYLGEDLFNWDQGLRRLALGAYLDVPEEPAEARIEVDGESYLPEAVSVSDVDAASAMNVMVQSLVKDAGWLREHRASMEDWGEIFASLVETYLVINPEEGAGGGDDFKDIERVKSSLSELGELPEVGEIGYRTAYLFAADRLSAMQTGAGRRFTGGVVVSTPDRLRGLPFEHVFVMGMGEGVYPATDPKSELDLRLQQRRVGDVRPSQRDRYHFLELLKSARSSLTVSWVGREASTGEELPASSVVADLRRMAPVDASELSAENQEAPLTTVHPLRRYDRHGDYFAEFGLPTDDRAGAKEVSGALGRNFHPEAFREAQMSALREAMEVARESEARAGREIWTGEAFRSVQGRLFDAQDEAAGGEAENKAQMLRMLSPANEGAAVPREWLPDQVRISKLAKFLKTPLQTKAKMLLRIYGDEEDAFAEEVERLELGPLYSAILVSGVAADILDQQPQFPSETELRVRVREEMRAGFAPGELPGEVFGDSASADLAEDLAAIGENMAGFLAEKFGLKLDEPVQPVVFSTRPAEGQYQAALIRRPGEGAPENELPVIGSTPMYLNQSNAFLDVTKRKNPEARDFLTGYISHLVLSASDGAPAGVSRKMVVLPTNGWTEGSYDSTFAKAVREFPPVTDSQAVDALSALAQQLFDPDAFPLLPIELVESIDEDGRGVTRNEAWRMAIDQDSGYRSDLRTQYGPVHDYLNYPPPDDPVETVRERFRCHPALGNPEGEQ